tara:strand:+ start:301 stop:474 length:174 start_codon:yes stop_codon:yes gene_type:complete
MTEVFTSGFLLGTAFGFALIWFWCWSHERAAIKQRRRTAEIQEQLDLVADQIREQCT